MFSYTPIFAFVNPVIYYGDCKPVNVFFKSSFVMIGKLDSMMGHCFSWVMVTTLKRQDH